MNDDYMVLCDFWLADERSVVSVRCRSCDTQLPHEQEGRHVMVQTHTCQSPYIEFAMAATADVEGLA